LWRAATLPFVLLVWDISLLVFTAFPLYERWLNVKRKRVGLIAFDLGRGGIQIILWGLCLLVLAVLALFSNTFGWCDVLRWGLAALAVVLVVSIDLSGSTPVLKSGLHPDRLFQVSLDKEKCIACGICERVCPRNCFQIDHQRHMETMPGAARCVQCGACIVQCPTDALSFHGPKGEVVSPETVRTFKLDLMGSRATRNQ
jgi:NAD-dependent dihydropyrimidine dehydrogenase PreA subunit